MVSAAHDVSDGGLGACLAEMAVAAGIGAHVARIDGHAALFHEAAGRVVVAVAADRLSEVEDAALAASVRATRLGLATGDRLIVKDLCEMALADLTASARDRLPVALGQGTTQG